MRMVVVGVGLNIARPEATAVVALGASSPATAMPPAGLAELLMGLTAGEALQRVAAPLVRDLLTFEAQGFAAFATRFAERDALQGLTVALTDGTQGVARGVDAQGALQVFTDEGVRTITSSEVSVRPC